MKNFLKEVGTLASCFVAIIGLVVGIVTGVNLIWFSNYEPPGPFESPERQAQLRLALIEGHATFSGLPRLTDEDREKWYAEVEQFAQYIEQRGN